MCWSASVSLNTFIFSLFGTVFALFNGTITMSHALFILSFASMQLAEFLAWRNLGDTRFASKLALFLVLLQPLLSIHAFYKGPYKSQILAVYFGAVLLMFATHVFKFTMHRAPNGHLAWDWILMPMWFLAIWHVLLFLGMLHNGVLEFSVALAILLVSVYTYRRDNTWGSMWCWAVNGSALWLIGEVFYKELCI